MDQSSRHFTILFLTLEDIGLQKGSATHIREKVAAFRRRGHRVLLAAGSPKRNKAQDYYPLGTFRDEEGHLRLGALPLVFAGLLSKILQLSRNVDVIYFREPVAAFAAVLTKPLHRKKLIYEVNSLDNEELKMKGGAAADVLYVVYDLFQRLGGRYSDRIFVITQRVKEYFQRKYDVPASKIRIQAVTTDPQKFRPVQEESLLVQLRQKLGLSQADLVITFTGNLAPWQDFHLLLESARLVLQKHPNARFLILGGGVQKEWLERAVAQESLLKNILLLGSVPHDEIPLYLGISDICISLSKELASGYSPMKLFEYIACGKPVVATKVSGYEIIEQIGAGRLVQPGDAAGFAKAILELVDDATLRIRLGQNARRFAEENFGWDRVIEKIENSLEELLDFTSAP